MTFTIFRPPLIYGPRAPGHFRLLLKLVTTRCPLPLGDFKNRRHFLFLENFVDAINGAIGAKAAINQVFNVADAKAISTVEMIEYIAAALEFRSPVFYVPRGIVEFFVTLLGQRKRLKKMMDNCEIDSLQLQNTLNWKAPYSTQDGIRQSLMKGDSVS